MNKLAFLSEKNLGQVWEIAQTEITNCPWQKKDFELAVSDKNYFSLVYEIDGQVATFAIFSLASEEASLLLIATKKSFVRQNLASKLFSNAILELKKRDFLKVFLEVSAKNMPAINFYHKLGFKPLRTRKNYYTDGSDAIEFYKEI